MEIKMEQFNAQATLWPLPDNWEYTREARMARSDESYATFRFEKGKPPRAEPMSGPSAYPQFIVRRKLPDCPDAGRVSELARALGMMANAQLKALDALHVSRLGGAPDEDVERAREYLADAAVILTKSGAFPRFPTEDTPRAR